MLRKTIINYLLTLQEKEIELNNNNSNSNNNNSNSNSNNNNKHNNNSNINEWQGLQELCRMYNKVSNNAWSSDNIKEYINIKVNKQHLMDRYGQDII